MKTFKQFCESVKPFPTSPSRLTPGKGYPLGVPFINLKKDMENKIFKWQTSKGSKKSSPIKTTWYQLKDIKTCFVMRIQEQ